MSRSAAHQISSGIPAYNPISNLERQYASPVGQRQHVFVRLNPNCCLIGGVEALLKQKKNQPLLSTAAGTRIANNVATEAESSVSPTTAATTGDDPFAFLNQQRDGGVVSPPTDTNVSDKKQPRHKVGKFFTNLAKQTQQGLKQTQQGLEKKITNLAIRADHGHNPDLLNVGLYDASGTQLWSLTESQILPNTDYERMKGVIFSVPLTIPPQVTMDPTTIITLKLWIKSGATLLKQTGKHYLLGQCHLPMESLRFSQVMASKNVSLQSSAVVDGQLQLLVCRDFKFPPLYGRGWSLTDPGMNGYAQGSHFNLPLDQSYGFNKNSEWWIATERATESAVVLPAAVALTKLARNACQKSLTHATSVSSELLANRHDTNLGEEATVQVEVGYLLLDDANLASTAQLSIHWQRPDCIYEVELMSSTNVPLQTLQVPFSRGMPTTTFYPRIVTHGILPAILQQYTAAPPGYLIGNLRISIGVSPAKTGIMDPFATTATGSQSIMATEEIWQATFPLETYANQSTNETLSVPVHHTVTGAPMGKLALQLKVTLPQQPQPVLQVVSSSGGLTSMMGLTIDDLGTLPYLDRDAPIESPLDPQAQRRQQQLKTMGHFVTHEFLKDHVAKVRFRDLTILTDRAESYQKALSHTSREESLPSHKDREPKSFRPSASRITETLAGIPFNVHTVTLSVEQGPNPSKNGGFFFNTTCGAPADHARDFGPLFQNGPSGGLRRLEAKRLEWLQKLHDAHSALIQAVANFYVTARHNNQVVFHIPARNTQIAASRWKVFELTQQYHEITWTCTVRRLNVFSQALGIALTSYLTSISQNTNWPDLWVKHGFLITFEGLLSAAGKELGMIEDAAVGIAMLKNVSVQLVSTETAAPAESVNIVDSPHLKWIHISTSDTLDSATEFIVKLGIEPQYWKTRVAEPLKRAAVRFYPLLYQVGVDIRQAAAHAQRNAKNQLLNSSANPSSKSEGENLDEDDDDDDDGVADTDVLVALNNEALQKMNFYANSISPISPALSTQDLGNQQHQIHPVLAPLHSHIVGSSGKMNHSILDEAATVAQKLGGAGVVFCKSGKDRTAMHVTYKQAQYVHRFLQIDDTNNTLEKVYNDATKLRVYGTRLPICEKNVGQAKYAFNTLQVRFMPDMLKPPISTLAGFLKGGAVFKGGGIES